VDILSERIRSGDRLLLCTRGLANALSNEEMLVRVRQLGPRRAPDDLVDLALGRGVASSLTALVISAPGAPSPGIILTDRSPRSSAVSIEPPLPVVPESIERSRKRRNGVPRTALLLAASVVLLAIMAPRLSESAGNVVPVVLDAAPAVAESVSGLTHELVHLFPADRPEGGAGVEAAPSVLQALPTATVTEVPDLPGQTATAIVELAEIQRATAAAESTSIIAAAAVEATEGAVALQASASRATQERATAQAAATATAGAGSALAVFPPVRSLVLTQPVKDASASGKVVFDWTWSGALGPGQSFNVRVCRGPACVPVEGKGLPQQSPWWWCPDDGPGIYRWQVALVGGGSVADGPVSDVGQFVWTGGEPCEVPASSVTEEDRDDPTPEPTKEKAPPPVVPNEPGP
jgi:hypothetical protein